MSALINYSIRVDKLPKEKFVAGKDGAVYLNLTIRNVKKIPLTPWTSSIVCDCLFIFMRHPVYFSAFNVA